MECCIGTLEVLPVCAGCMLSEAYANTVITANIAAITNNGIALNMLTPSYQ